MQTWVSGGSPPAETLPGGMLMDRRYELDLTRMFACLMVVLLHTAATGWHIDPSLPEWRYYNLADMAARAGGLPFFMVPGAPFF